MSAILGDVQCGYVVVLWEGGGESIHLWVGIRADCEQLRHTILHASVVSRSWRVTIP